MTEAGVVPVSKGIRTTSIRSRRRSAGRTCATRLTGWRPARCWRRPRHCLTRISLPAPNALRAGTRNHAERSSDAANTPSPRAGSLPIGSHRKYRPASFAEVVGQAHAHRAVVGGAGCHRINHAYLFSGPRTAERHRQRILARSLNCAALPPTRAGSAESRSVGVNAPGSIDVVELDAASHAGRHPRAADRAFYAPVRSRYRVFITRRTW